MAQRVFSKVQAGARKADAGSGRTAAILNMSALSPNTPGIGTLKRPPRNEPDAHGKDEHSMRLAISALLLCIASFGSFSRAQEFPAGPDKSGEEGVDDYVQRLMAKRHIPGVSVAVVKDGKVVLAKGYGLASVELGVPATADTVYQLASVTKTFTATAVMMLAREGKLSLEDKITERLPNLPEVWKDV